MEWTSKNGKWSVRIKKEQTRWPWLDIVVCAYDHVNGATHEGVTDGYRLFWETDVPAYVKQKAWSMVKKHMKGR